MASSRRNAAAEEEKDGVAETLIPGVVMRRHHDPATCSDYSAVDEEGTKPRRYQESDACLKFAEKEKQAMGYAQTEIQDLETTKTVSEAKTASKG